MKDVTVTVGGLKSGGLYSSSINNTGTVDTDGARIVMVENFSPVVFQIGNEAIPPMYRRTFAIDNYPSLNWTIGNAGTPVTQNIFGPVRTVRILLDPVINVADGPVYPVTIPVSGAIQVGLPGNHETIVYARDVLVGQADIQRTRDEAFLAVEWHGTGMNTSPNHILYSNVPQGANPLIGNVGNSVGVMGTEYRGKDWSYYTELPGPNCLTFELDSDLTVGACGYTVWVGYHL